VASPFSRVAIAPAEEKYLIQPLPGA